MMKVSDGSAGNIEHDGETLFTEPELSSRTVSLVVVVIASLVSVTLYVVTGCRFKMIRQRLIRLDIAKLEGIII